MPPYGLSKAPACMKSLFVFRRLFALSDCFHSEGFRPQSSKSGSSFPLSIRFTLSAPFASLPSIQHAGNVQPQKLRDGIRRHLVIVRLRQAGYRDRADHPLLP